MDGRTYRDSCPSGLLARRRETDEEADNSVLAVLRERYARGEIDDEEYETCRAILEAAWTTNCPENHEFLLRGTDVGACFDRDKNSLNLYESSKHGADHLADTDITTRANDALMAEQASFLEGVKSGDPPERNMLEEDLTV